MDEILNKIYYDSSNPAGYSSAIKLHKAAKLENPKITLSFVREWLAKQLTYTLHKPRRITFRRSKTVVTGENVQWQADLVDLRLYSKFNKNCNYLLTVIDTFSRYAWVECLKTKSGGDLRKAFENIFKDEIPTAIQTDNGTEFKNSDVQSLFESLNIQFFTTRDESVKCALIERFNRTLKDKMFKLMTKTGSRSYIQHLPPLINAYNRTIHRSTGEKPIEVNEQNEEKIFERLYGFKDKREMLMNEMRKTPKLEVGDLVRIRYQSNVFDRGYYPNWTDEVYEIVKTIKANPPYYILKDYQGNVIEGRFYEQEVQRVIDPSYRVEKILKKRRRNGIEECLVKWVNFPSSHNQWIPAENVGDI